MDGDSSKKRKRKSGLEAGTSREFKEIEPEAEPEAKPTNVLGSDDDAQLWRMTRAYPQAT